MSEELNKEEIDKLFSQAKGYHLEEQYDQAFSLFTELAELGSDNAQNHLGFYYQRGLGTPQDYEKALYWYKKAADQGSPYAQNNLGLLYERGPDTLQDYGEAIHWFTKSAIQEHREAQVNLGLMYDSGHGVKQDYELAAHWFCQAAAQGHGGASFFLGDYFETGCGVVQDDGLAIYWYTKALKQGTEEAEEALHRLHAQKQNLLPSIDIQFDIKEQPLSKPVKTRLSFSTLIDKNIEKAGIAKEVRRLETEYPATPAQIRLLSLGALSFYDNWETCRTFKIHQDIRRIIPMLSSQWGIQCRDEAMSTLVKLSSCETHTPFADDIYNAFVLKGKLDKVLPTDLFHITGINQSIIYTIDFIFPPNQLLLLTNEEAQAHFWGLVISHLCERINERLTSFITAKNILIKLGYTEAELSKVESTVAWDLGRTAIVARYCVHSGYITENEAWEFMEIAASHAEKIYTDWRNYFAAYIFGRALGYGSDCTDVYSTIRFLVTNKKSPFKEVSFK